MSNISQKAKMGLPGKTRRIRMRLVQMPGHEMNCGTGVVKAVISDLAEYFSKPKKRPVARRR